MLPYGVLHSIDRLRAANIPLVYKKVQQVKRGRVASISIEQVSTDKIQSR